MLETGQFTLHWKGARFIPVEHLYVRTPTYNITPAFISEVVQTISER